MKKVIRNIFLVLGFGVLLGVGIFQFMPATKDIFVNKVYDSFSNLISVVDDWFIQNLGKVSDIDLSSILVDGEEVTNQQKESKGLSGSDYTFDGTYDVYYTLLTDSEKSLYAQIVANVEAVNESFTPEVSGLTESNVENAYQAVLFDHPEYFWMDSQYAFKYIESGEVVEVDIVYNDLAKGLVDNKSAFDEQCNAIISQTFAYTSESDKEKVVHDALLELCIYDLNATYNQTSYSALVNHSSVCAGYAKAFQYIMKKLGIPCYYVTGVSENEDHAWNIVYIDGSWKNVDLTWDDASNNRYLFYNLSDSQMSQTHIRSEISSLLPSCE